MSTENQTPQAPTPSDVPNTSFDDLLNQTDIGSVIAKNKSAFATLLIVIIVGIIGGGFYKHMSKKNNAQYADKIYTFKENELKNFKEKKIEAKKLVELFAVLAKDVKENDSLFLFGIEVVDLLMNSENFSEGLEVIKIVEGINSSTIGSFLVASRKAVLFEDLNRTDDAISTLEKALSSSNKVFELKVYFDLGRLYLMKGDKDKSMKSFKYVLDNDKKGDFKRLVTAFMKGAK